MLQQTYRPHFYALLRLCLGTCVALALICGVFSSHAYAISLLPAAGPTLQVSAGFNSRYQAKDGIWVPVQVTLQNSGADFNGKLSIKPPSLSVGGSADVTFYQQTISLPAGSQKQVTLYIPLATGLSGLSQAVIVDLLDNNGQKVTSQQATLRALNTGDMFIGLLSNQSTGFGAISQIKPSAPGAQVITEQLTATSMPQSVEALKNFDVIALDHFDTTSLSKEQLATLERWVAQGGTLILVGGPEWRGSFAGLPEGLIPVTVTGTITLPTGTSLFPVGTPGQTDAAPGPVTVSTGSAKAGTSVLQTSGTTPLVAQANYDRGKVFYLAYDPQLEPLAGWTNTTALWKGLLLRAAGDQFLSTSQTTNNGLKMGTFSADSGMNSLLQSLFPNALPAIWLILVLLVGYVLILGPGRLVLVRFLKKRDWSWRIALSTIVVFSLLSYGLALMQKGTSVVSSSLTVIQLSKPTSNTSQASFADYVGVFVPSEGDFQVQIAGQNLVQPLSSNSYYGPSVGGAQRSTITTTANSTNVVLQSVENWTMRSLVSKHQTQVKGGLTSQLQYKNTLLTGTVTNTLPYGLKDAYLLVGSQFVALGEIKAGETRQVNTSLLFSPNTSCRNRSGGTCTLADQIAGSRGLQTPYSTMGYYGQPQQPKTNFERHMATLSALSGVGDPYGYMSGVPINVGANGSVIYVSGAGVGALSPGARDPLLIPNATATLIGWADRTPDGSAPITINDKPLSGTQDALIKAPLDITFSGALSLPAVFAPGQISDAQGQGTDVQAIYQGIYFLSNQSSITFEYDLSGLPKLQSTSMTFSEPPNLNSSIINKGGPNTGTLSTVDQLRAFVYNWQKGTWDSFSFTQSSLTIPNAQAYVGPGGRVLLKMEHDKSQAQTLTTIPSLDLQIVTASA
jgi:hypothetical protein